ncbi:family 16 glycosylhydrolase [Brevundimonas variabilis]|uniref:Beta-glucanase (GH16 family) n=1 Tax=Brevundimonas variabilis TaxID=74312 RepID=A0A7W9CIP8_9CAUL|nr:family 16 glycosylhydrolase [Brevundimonas variabilis]MBB5746362.1 beta-glucanase (GH16 family) [Brevundimonas variabilis]
MPYVNAVGRVLHESAPSSRWQTATTPGQVLTGSSIHETLTGGRGHTLVGGDGDDIYGLTGPAVIRETAGGGTDTMSVWASAELPDHVENLLMNGGWGWYAIGNDLDNIITGTGGRQQIDGGSGNDVLIGGDGADLFVMSRGNGSDVIVDFGAGADQIRLAGYGLHSFGDVLAIARQTGSDVVLNLTAGEILILRNVSLTSLEAQDFLLEIDLSRFTQTFSEEFDSLRLSPSGGVWDTFYSHNDSASLLSRYHAGEAQIYVDPLFAGTSGRALGLNPFSIANGVLTITAAPVTTSAAPFLGGQTYTSGLLTTESSFAQQYGYFEIRAALPAGQGFWPAFWLLPEDGSWPPEIDVFEMLGRDPDTFYYSTHTIENGQHVLQTGQYRVDTTDFHVYGVDWGPQNITFYLDGVAIAQVPTPDSMHRPFYMLLNLAVGGTWGGAPDETTGTGLMQVDYVRAWAYATAPDKGSDLQICWNAAVVDGIESGPSTIDMAVPKPAPLVIGVLDWADDFLIGSSDFAAPPGFESVDDGSTAGYGDAGSSGSLGDFGGIAGNPFHDISHQEGLAWLSIAPTEHSADGFLL